MNLVIYGAKSIALGTYEAIHNLYPIRKVSCFLVSEYKDNPHQLAGLPVYELETYANMLSEEEKQNTEILIATPENVMPEIESLLEKYVFFCHVRQTSTRFAQMMSYRGNDKGYIPLSALPVGFHKVKLQVFITKFYKDKPLSVRYSMPDWITPIQAGASLCKERIAPILDCDGEHISEKNGNYSELTALYWIWKNRLSMGSDDSGFDGIEYYGLNHYRRIFELSEDDSLRLLDNGVDVVLPYPMPYEPDMEAHHRRYIKENDWNAVLLALEELCPEYAKLVPVILKQKYMYNYNILIAKKEVLAEYCQWLFPLLERIEELSKPKGEERSDRYIGYIGETLETIYFMANKDKLTVVHAGCRFLT